jgi:hypothetical protein
MDGKRASAGFGDAMQAVLAKLTGSRLFWVVFVGVLFALPLGRSMARTLPPSPPTIGEARPFELLDQYGSIVGTQQLLGHVWVVAQLPPEGAITHAEAIETVRTVIHRTKNLGTLFRMVTLPEEDRSALGEADRRILVEKYCSSSQLWLYLGGSAEQVERAKHALYDTVELGGVGSAGGPVALLLLDRRGAIRGAYGTDKASIDRLMSDTSYIANLP